MNELHLFAGIGGGVLAGVLLGHRCVGAVELDPYCRRVLEARQRDGILEPFPIHDDIRTFDGTAWRGRVDIVCGGFPCQPWSSAGKRLGAADERHLWPEMARVVAECRPRFVFAENVSLAAFEEPWRDLRRLGYRVPPALRLGGCQMGAMFHRHRWWLLAADAADDGRRWRAASGGREAGRDAQGLLRPQSDEDVADASRGAGRTTGLAREYEGMGDAAEPYHGRQHAVAFNEEVACAPEARDADGSRLEGSGTSCGVSTALAIGRYSPWRAAAPRLRRLVSGHARGMESRRKRIHALGNAQVPVVAATAFLELMGRLA